MSWSVLVQGSSWSPHKHGPSGAIAGGDRPENRPASVLVLEVRAVVADGVVAAGRQEKFFA